MKFGLTEEEHNEGESKRLEQAALTVVFSNPMTASQLSVSQAAVDYSTAEASVPE